MLRFGSRKLPEPAPRWDLHTPLLEWTTGVVWTIAAACMGCQIFGSTGSGKSTGSLAAICLAFLRAGFGGLFLTVKREDVQTYTRYVQQAGRMDDLMIFSPAHDLKFNFIDCEMRGSKNTTGLVENLTSLLMTVTEIGQRGGGQEGRDNDRYFRLEATRLARNGLLLLALGTERVTVPALHQLITSAARSRKQVSDRDWQNDSFCFQCMQAADRAATTDSVRADLDLALSYFLNEWPSLSSRTRSVVESTLTSATDLLSRGAARDFLSSSEPNVSPEDMYAGKLLIVDFPVLVYRDIGQLIQVVIKHCWQRAHSRRQVDAMARPTFIVTDESHLLLVEADHLFATTARSTRTAIVNATQSISSYLDVLGQHADPKVHTLLGNLQLRICHQQTDIRTVQYMQELIGRSPRYTMNSSSSRDSDWLAPLFGGGGTSAGFTEVWDHELNASDLNSLAQGGPPHWTTQAIVYDGGRVFPHGKTWLPVSFRQSL